MKDGELGGACSTYGMALKSAYWVLSSKHEEKDSLCEDDSIILKWTLKMGWEGVVRVV